MTGLSCLVAGDPKSLETIENVIKKAGLSSSTKTAAVVFSNDA
jgi:hypothetical protein